MPGWFSSLFQRSKGSTRKTALFEALSDYPAYASPHEGDASKLTLGSAKENLGYLIAQSDTRVTLVTDFLQHRYDLDLENLSDGSEEALANDLSRLQDWFWEEFFTDDLNANFLTLRDITSRAGEHIAYSLVKDLSILLSGVIIERRQGVYWGLNLDPNDRLMSSYKEPVLLGLGSTAFDPRIVSYEQLLVAKMVNRTRHKSRQNEGLRNLPDGVPIQRILLEDLHCTQLHEIPVAWEGQERWAIRTAENPMLTDDSEKP